METAIVTPATAVFDKKESLQADVVVTVENSAVTAVKNGDVTISESNYTNESGVITLLSSYLATLANGENVFTFLTEDGANPTCTITVTQTPNATATPQQATFDKKASLQADVVVTVENSAVIAVKNGGIIVREDYYTNESGVITLLSLYLATLSNGAKAFTFVTEDGTNPTCTITITQSSGEMLEEVKVALRVTSNRFDDEIETLIAACKTDLRIAGVTAVDESDPIIKRVIVLYCKANFGYDNPESDKFQRSYDMLKCSLTLAGDYNGGGGGGDE